MQSTPRTISTAVAEKCSSSGPSSCSISAWWRWPVGAKERMAPERSGWWLPSLTAAPPSLLPTFTSMTARSMTPARASGSSARFTDVALQPTPLA